MRENEEKEEKINTPDLEVNVTYVDEAPAFDTAPEKHLFSSIPSKKIVIDDFDMNYGDDGKVQANRTILGIYEFNSTYTGNNQYSFEGLREYKNNGHSDAETYSFLLQGLKDCSNNSEQLENFVNNLLSEVVNYYDHDIKHNQVGNSQSDILSKILNTPEDGECPNLICGTIHGFVMNLLHDAGMEAVLVSGTQDGGHATLMYKNKDGEYIFNNYGQSINTHQSNLKSALCAAYQDEKFNSTGYFNISDGKSEWKEFALSQEAAFGEKMDKSDDDSKNPYDNQVPAKSSINANLDISNLGNIKAETGVDFVYESFGSKKATSLDLGYKKTGESNLFQNSTSVGIDLSHVQENNNGTYFSGNVTASYTQGQASSMDVKCVTPNADEYNKWCDGYDDFCKQTLDRLKAEGATDEELAKYAEKLDAQKPQYVDGTVVYSSTPQKQEIFSSTFRGTLGREFDLYSSDNLRLSNRTQGSAFFNFTKPLKISDAEFDTRFSAESALNLQAGNDKLDTSTTVGSGLLFDLKQKFATYNLRIAPGAKLNASTEVSYKPSEKVALDAKASGYSVFTDSSTHYGASGEVSGSYKPSSNLAFTGGANFSVDQEKLALGGFNEFVENKTSFGGFLGVQHKNNTFRIGVNHTKDNVLKSGNRTDVTVGAVIRF